MKQFINDRQWDGLDLRDAAANKVIADGIQLLLGHKHNSLSSHVPVVNSTCVHTYKQGENTHNMYVRITTNMYTL